MNKSDMIEQIAKSADISKAAAERALDAAVASIKAALRKGTPVTLVGFVACGLLARFDRAAVLHEAGDVEIGRNARNIRQQFGEAHATVHRAPPAAGNASIASTRPAEAGSCVCDAVGAAGATPA